MMLSVGRFVSSLSMYSIIIVIASLCVAFSPWYSLSVFARPEGADPAACSNGQEPVHGFGSSSPPSGTFIQFASTEYSACSPVLLTINTGKAFGGYLASITKLGDGSFSRYGTLESVQSGQSQAICAGSSGSGATHKNNSPKNNFQLRWTVPDPAPPQTIVASVTLVETLATWYKLPVVQLSHSATLVVPQLPQSLFIANANVDLFDFSTISFEWISSGFCHGNAAISLFEMEQDEQVNNQWNNTWKSVNTLPLDAAKSGSTFKNATIDNLEGGKFYRFRLAAKSAVGVGYSNIVSIKTALNTDTTPSAPTLSIVSVSDKSISLNWTLSSSSLTIIGYVLERSLSSSGPFTIITSGNYLSNTFTNNGLSVGTPYYYRIRSLNAAGFSSYSNVLTVRTSDPPTCGDGSVLPSGECICSKADFGSRCEIKSSMDYIWLDKAKNTMEISWTIVDSDVYFRLFVYGLSVGHSAAIMLGAPDGMTGGIAYRILYSGKDGGKDKIEVLQYNSAGKLTPEAAPASEFHLSSIISSTYTENNRLVIDIQFKRPLTIASKPSASISVNSSIAASYAIFRSTQWGTQHDEMGRKQFFFSSKANSVCSSFGTFINGHCVCQKQYTGPECETPAPMTFITLDNTNTMQIAWTVIDSDVYFRLFVSGLSVGQSAAIMLGAPDGMTGGIAYRVLYKARDSNGQDIIEVLQYNSGGKFAPSTAPAEENHVKNIVYTTRNEDNRHVIDVQFKRPLIIAKAAASIVLNEAIAASYAIFRSSGWGDGHTQQGRYRFVFSNTTASGVLSVSSDDDNGIRYYSVVIIGLAIIFVTTVLYSRPFGLDGSIPLSSIINHKRPWPIAPSPVSSHHYSSFDFLTLSLRHALFDWTVGEYMVIISYIIIVAVFLSVGSNEFGKRDRGYFIFGHCATVHLALTLMPITRHSIFSSLFNLPFERLIKWHRYLARMTVLWTFIHLLTMLQRYKPGGASPLLMEHVTSPIAGFIAFLLMLVQGLLANDFIRRKFHELFYYPHFFIGIGIILFAAVHVDIFRFFMIIPLVLFGIDQLWRRYQTFITVPLKQMKVLAEDTAPVTFIEIDVSQMKHFSYEAGQYIFLNVPEISFTEYHPFTISSAPINGKVTLHIMSMGEGTFTDKLLQLAKKTASDEHHQTAPAVRVRFDGAFGKLSVPIFTGHYRQLILIGGGVGFTPIASIAAELLSRYETGQLPSSLTNITIVWITRHRDIFLKWMPELLQKLSKAKDNFNLKLFLTTPASTIGSIDAVEEKNHAVIALTEIAKSKSTAEVIEKEKEGGKKESIELRVDIQSRSSNADGQKPRNSIHDQSEKSGDNKTNPSAPSSLPSFAITIGRPNLLSFFSEMNEIKKDGKGGVIVCGPLSMMNQVQAAADKYDYHLHKETFLL